MNLVFPGTGCKYCPFCNSDEHHGDQCNLKDFVEVKVVPNALEKPKDCPLKKSSVTVSAGENE